MRKFAIVLMTAMLGLGAIAPAQAQSFGIFFGDEPSDFASEYALCLTDSQIRQTVAARGYSDIALNVANEPMIQVRGTRQGWVYLLDFNYCTGQIEGRERLRAAN